MFTVESSGRLKRPYPSEVKGYLSRAGEFSVGERALASSKV